MATGPVPVRTARGAGRAAGRLLDVLRGVGFLAAGRLEVDALVVVCFLALGDRVLEPLARDEPVARVLLLREPVGEDVRVAMPPT